jgi:hypothetical protein
LPKKEASVATEKLTKTIVESLDPPSAGKTFLWDKTIAGFGVCVTHKGTRGLRHPI